MMTISSRVAATALASLLLMGSAFAQTTAPAKTDATKTEAKAPAKPRTAASLECSKQADEKGLKGKARMHTCVDQYNANKTTNGNGGLKWIQKGGGYYSECTKKLKG